MSTLFEIQRGTSVVSYGFAPTGLLKSVTFVRKNAMVGKVDRLNSAGQAAR